MNADSPSSIQATWDAPADAEVIEQEQSGRYNAVKPSRLTVEVYAMRDGWHAHVVVEGRKVTRAGVTTRQETRAVYWRELRHKHRAGLNSAPAWVQEIARPAIDRILELVA